MIEAYEFMSRFCEGNNIVLEHVNGPVNDLYSGLTYRNPRLKPKIVLGRFEYIHTPRVSIVLSHEIGHALTPYISVSSGAGLDRLKRLTRNEKMILIEDEKTAWLRGFSILSRISCMIKYLQMARELSFKDLLNYEKHMNGIS